jgi:hypothetical protein
MEIEEEHSSSRSRPFQREKGYNYSIPLWKGKNSTAQNMFNADEEVKRLAKYAESKYRQHPKTRGSSEIWITGISLAFIL